jgi:hypothetical protein
MSTGVHNILAKAKCILAHDTDAIHARFEQEINQEKIAQVSHQSG